MKRGQAGSVCEELPARAASCDSWKQQSKQPPGRSRGRGRTGGAGVKWGQEGLSCLMHWHSSSPGEGVAPPGGPAGQGGGGEHSNAPPNRGVKPLSLLGKAQMGKLRHREGQIHSRAQDGPWLGWAEPPRHPLTPTAKPVLSARILPPGSFPGHGRNKNQRVLWPSQDRVPGEWGPRERQGWEQ